MPRKAISIAISIAMLCLGLVTTPTQVKANHHHHANSCKLGLEGTYDAASTTSIWADDDVEFEVTLDSGLSKATAKAEKEFVEFLIQQDGALAVVESVLQTTVASVDHVRVTVDCGDDE